MMARGEMGALGRRSRARAKQIAAARRAGRERRAAAAELGTGSAQALPPRARLCGPTARALGMSAGALRRPGLLQSLLHSLLLLLQLPSALGQAQCPADREAVDCRLSTDGHESKVFVGGLFDNNMEIGSEFLRAAEMINDHSDGMWDEVLVGTELEVKLGTQPCSDGTFAMANFVEQLRDWGRPLHGAVGPRCSTQTMVVARIAGMEEVPLVSHSATNPDLSNTEAFPFFSRVAAPDSEQFKATKGLLRHFGWTKVVVLNSDTAYATVSTTARHPNCSHCATFRAVLTAVAVSRALPPPSRTTGAKNTTTPPASGRARSIRRRGLCSSTARPTTSTKPAWTSSSTSWRRARRWPAAVSSSLRCTPTTPKSSSTR